MNILLTIICDPSRGIRPEETTTSEYQTTWSLPVKTRDDVTNVLTALRALARYYPDGSGEIK